MKKYPQLIFDSAWKFPVELYSPFRHDAALLTAGQDIAAAIAFFEISAIRESQSYY